MRARHADGFEDFLDARLVLRRQPVEQRGKDAALPVERQLDIVPDRMAFEHGRLLEFAADAELGDVGLVLLGEVDVAVEEDLALIRPGLAGDDVHHRRLAGTVRADDGAQFARFDDEGQRVQRLEAVEGHRDAVEVENALAEVFAFIAVLLRGLGFGCGELALGPRLPPCPGRPARRASACPPLLSRCQGDCCNVPTIPLGRNSVVATNSAPSANSQNSGKAAVKMLLPKLTRIAPMIGPIKRAAPADRRPDDHFDRVGRREFAGVDDADLRHVERAGDARHHRRDGEDEELHVLHPVAEEAGPAFRIAHADQHLAVFGADDGRS